MRTKKILEIVIPAFNEEEFIKKSVFEINKQFKNSNNAIGFIIVDDASTDQTWEEVLDVSYSLKNVQALKFSRNLGKENAIKAGLSLVTAEYSLTVDADGEHPFNEISKILQRAKSNNLNIVYGKRTFKRKSAPLIRSIASKFFNFVIGAKGIYSSGLTDFILLDSLARKELLNGSKGIYRFLVQEIGFEKKHHDFIPVFIKRKSKWTLKKLINLALSIIIYHSNLLQRLLASFALTLVTLITWITIKALYSQDSEVPTGYLTVLFLLLINLLLTLTSIAYLYLALIKTRSNLIGSNFPIWKKTRNE